MCLGRSENKGKCSALFFIIASSTLRLRSHFPSVFRKEKPIRNNQCTPNSDVGIGQQRKVLSRPDAGPAHLSHLSRGHCQQLYKVQLFEAATLHLGT